jgi:scyllo-inositol 2-dehydrogenase (NADP+)
MSSVRTAIIGFGKAARHFHKTLIECVEGLELVGVSTSRPEGVPPHVRVASASALLGDPTIELIVVTTSNDAHFGIAGAALENGKHVVVDKPFCVSADEAATLIDKAAAAGKMLTVFHNRRWDSDFLTVADLIRSGDLGSIKLFEAHWDRFRTAVEDRWRERPILGGGLLYDLGPHLIDQALLLFGLPEAISGDILAQRNGALVDDYFCLTLHYGDLRVVLAASNLVAAPRPRFSVHGTGGSFVKFGLDAQEDQLKAKLNPLDPSFGVEDVSVSGHLTSGDGDESTVPSRRGDWLDFYRGVVSAIAGTAPAPVSAIDALQGLKVIELARLSSRERRILPFV